MHVNELLKLAVEAGASDLHLKVGSYPMMRVRGNLVPANEDARLTHEDTVGMAAAVMSTQQRQKFKDSLEIDLAYSVPGLGRFRCCVDITAAAMPTVSSCVSRASSFAGTRLPRTRIIG